MGSGEAARRESREYRWPQPSRQSSPCLPTSRNPLPPSPASRATAKAASGTLPAIIATCCTSGAPLELGSATKPELLGAVVALLGQRERIVEAQRSER